MVFILVSSLVLWMGNLKASYWSPSLIIAWWDGNFQNFLFPPSRSPQFFLFPLGWLPYNQLIVIFYFLALFSSEGFGKHFPNWSLGWGMQSKNIQKQVKMQYKLSILFYFILFFPWYMDQCIQSKAIAFVSIVKMIKTCNF